MIVPDIRRPAWWRSVLLVALLCLASGPALAERINVFAAASLQNVLAELSGIWSAKTGHQVVVVPAGSSVLARQIQQGAPADIFISANAAWMDALQQDGLIRAGSRVRLMTNRLVLISSNAKDRPVRLGPETDLTERLQGQRLAMALIDAVPAGIYGKAALQNLGMWQPVRRHVAEADNVRAALALVKTGEAPLGIVYLTDALAGNAHVIATFAVGSHPPIVYPAALVSDSRSKMAGVFLDFLQGGQAASILVRHGFQVVN